MAGEPEKTDSFEDALTRLAALRRFSGPPAVFWQSYLDVLVAVSEARFGVVVRKREKEATSWRKVVASPANLSSGSLGTFFASVESLCEASLEGGDALVEFDGESKGEAPSYGIAIHLETGRGTERWVAVFLLEKVGKSEAKEAKKRLLLTHCIPADLQRFQSENRAPGAAFQASSLLDLMALLDAKKRFLELAMTLVNELAGRHFCERVSLGWEERGYVRVKAISHSDKFEGKMEAVQDLELVMEEALDQDEEIYWPPLDGETLITRDHAKFAASQGVQHLCSIPLRLAGEPVGVITLERSTEAFLEDEIRLLRIAADMAAPRIADLKERDRWFGARMAGGFRRLCGRVLGPEKTWAKVLALGGAIALAVLFFGTAGYRVEAPFLLRTTNIAYLSAPFDGYITAVDTEVGDVFAKEQRLLSLDTRELFLEEASAAANLSHYRREEEKSRARNELAEMRIAAAQAEQTQASLDIIRFRLAQAEIRASFDGIVVEGDLKKRLGAPVKQGDVLFKLARLDRLYVECEVSERDIHEVRLGTNVELSFASRPKDTFEAKVALIEPVATITEDESVFIVRCELQSEPEDWWRPGMGGITKIAVEDRTFAWIFFHRTVDFLRLFLWW